MKSIKILQTRSKNNNISQQNKKPIFFLFSKKAPNGAKSLSTHSCFDGITDKNEVYQIPLKQNCSSKFFVPSTGKNDLFLFAVRGKTELVVLGAARAVHS